MIFNLEAQVQPEESRRSIGKHIQLGVMGDLRS